MAGNEGLFNLGITGTGILVLESECPKEELIEITLDNDVLKVDGNMAIAWSGSLSFTVERSGIRSNASLQIRSLVFSRF